MPGNFEEGVLVLEAHPKQCQCYIYMFLHCSAMHTITCLDGVGGEGGLLWTLHVLGSFDL